MSGGAKRAARACFKPWLLVLSVSACGGQARDTRADAARANGGAQTLGEASGEVATADAGPTGAGSSGSEDGRGVGSEDGRGGAGSADGNGVAGSADGKGSAGSAGGGAGTAPTAHSARDCENPSPRARGGGYSVCGDGSLRRASAAACESSLPRAKADLPLVFSACTSDNDCTSAPHGYCAYGACEYGCVEDAECSAGEACFCGEAIGKCIPAGCHGDADCPADLPCTAFQAPGFTTPDTLSCQSPLDECVTDAQCNSLNPRVSCKVQETHRICYRDTVG